MEKHEAEKLIEVIRSFTGGERAGKSARLDVQAGTGGKATTETTAPDREFRSGSNGSGEVPAMFAAGVAAAGQAFDEEAMYQRFRARFIDDAKMDPVLLNLIMVQPEIIVEYERRSETLDGSSLRGRIAKLIAGGFFDDPKTNGNTVTELRRIGTEPNSGNVSRAIADLISSGFLTRVGSDKFQRAPGVKITERALEVKA